VAEIDFNAYLAGNELYQQQIDAINKAQTFDETQRNAAIYQGLINYGELPQTVDANGQPIAGVSQNVLDFLGTIPQSVKDAVGLATQGGLSQLAQRLQTQRDAQSLMRGNLGERGIIRSGDYAYLTNKNARAEQLARAGDLQGLLGGFNTAWGTFLDQMAGLRGERGTASQSAWQRMMDAINAKAAADALAAQTTPTVPDIPNPNANPNNPTLVPNMFEPTPTNTPGLNIPAVDEQGYAIPQGPLYPDPTDIGGFHQGALPSTPFTPLDNGPWDPSGPNGENVLSMEPRTNIDTLAYGPQGVANPDPVYNTPTVDPYAGYIQGSAGQGSEYAGDPYDPYAGYVQGSAGQGSEYVSDQPNDYAPLVADYLNFAAPVPGYGGPAPAGAPAGSTSTYYQNQRNML
jgi:hypothetical protein